MSCEYEHFFAGLKMRAPPTVRLDGHRKCRQNFGQNAKTPWGRRPVEPSGRQTLTQTTKPDANAVYAIEQEASRESNPSGEADVSVQRSISPSSRTFTDCFELWTPDTQVVSQLAGDNDSDNNQGFQIVAEFDPPKGSAYDIDRGNQTLPLNSGFVQLTLASARTS